VERLGSEIFGKKLKKKEQKWMAHEGIEPATFALLARRSNQLS
jgi:hypothetical protein